jgi:glycosyltransferase involved in cell wall biosynthesis
MADPPIRVALVTGEPTPYRTPHLRALAARPELDLTVFYAAPTVQRRTWRVEHEEAVYLTGPKLPLARILHHDYVLTPGIWRKLDRGRFELVVVGGWSLMATQLAIAWSRRRKVPYVLMSDNHLREPRPPWVRAVKRAVLPRIVPQAAAWLVPGSLARDHIVAYGARPERTLVFPLTVDVAAFAAKVDALRAELPARDEVVALHVGRLIAHKAVDVLVRAAATAGVRLHVVGDGPERESLGELAASLGAQVTFAGELQGDELAAAYAGADIFALASRRETWGVVVNEAAAAGLPLVLSDAVGAAGDLLEDGANGLLVPTGDAVRLASALERLAADSTLRQRMGARSRQLVADWGYERSVEAFVRLARELVR